ncbi:MAG: YezD family protein [Candidatus Omnitrophica bacterium]|nr:YezD family protein [Candidatus Omnitrophota bacterium]
MMGPKEPVPKYSINDTILKNIREAIGSIDFGSVEIKIHDSKIVQIEVTERKRFDDIWRIEGGGGI